jgi:hypothetical protein
VGSFDERDADAQLPQRQLAGRIVVAEHLAGQRLEVAVELPGLGLDVGSRLGGGRAAVGRPAGGGYLVHPTILLIRIN